MWTHQLKIIKGFGMNQLDYKAKVCATTTGLNAGMVCSLDTAGEIVKGLIAGAMPLFAISNQTDFDVVGDAGGTTVDEATVNTTGIVAAGTGITYVNGQIQLPLVPPLATDNASSLATTLSTAAAMGLASAGVLGVLVGTGAFELQSTEYVTPGYTFYPNDPLTSAAPASGGSVANVGKLKVGTPYTDTICGVVSKGLITNEWGKSAVQFWTTWLPPTTFTVNSTTPFVETGE